MSYRLNETFELEMIKWVRTALSDTTITYKNATINIRDAVVGATYTTTVNGTSFNYVALAGTTTTIIASALYALINAGGLAITITDNLNGSYTISSTTTFTLKTDVRQMHFLAIWDKQDAYVQYPVKPALPYATLNILSVVSNGAPEYERKSTGIYTLNQQKEITLSINIFSNNNHMGLMSMLATSLRRTPILSYLLAGGLTFRRNSDPLDVSLLLDTKHELRSQMDVSFAYVDSIDDELGQIDTVTYTPTFSGVEKDLVTIPEEGN